MKRTLHSFSTFLAILALAGASTVWAAGGGSGEEGDTDDNIDIYLALGAAALIGAILLLDVFSGPEGDPISAEPADVIPPETWDNLDNVADDYYEWYNGIDELKQNAADRILTPIVENLADAEGGTTFKYSLTKEPLGPWNMVIGGQYQVNKHWQLRAEAGIIGNRNSLLISGNYRFGIAHK